MSRGMTKAERLEKMKFLYMQRAYADIDMAEKLGVNRSTVFRDRRALTIEYMVDKDAEGRFYIDRGQLLSSIKVNLHEALSLYLAARKSSRQTRYHQPHTASALEKLAAALRQPMTARLLKTADRLLNQAKEPARVKTLETLAQAWVEQRKARIDYQGLHSRQVYEHIIRPYLIEPSIWSDSIYVIAFSENRNKVMAFKIERVSAANLLGELFETPADFDDQKLLEHAWGIWDADQPQLVRLRFSPSVTRRVKESIWHPLEKVTDTEDGGCLWEALIAEPREMLPWVRGWGADCEVLEPEGMRKMLEREARKMAKLYAIDAKPSNPIYYAHSKKNVPEDQWQLLIDHLRRTAEIAREMGEPAGIADLASVAAWLHDIGKYSFAFQERLRGSRRLVDHSAAGAREVVELFTKPSEKEYAELISYCIAGHHAGLPDYGDPTDLSASSTLVARREKKNLEDYKAYRNEVNASHLSLHSRQIIPAKDYPYFSISFLTRMLYSVLVDADWLETESYMEEEAVQRSGYDSIAVLCERFNHYLERFSNPQSAINKKRNETLNTCVEKSLQKPGFFKLTVPTGGGKTLASMAFGLNHAVANDLQRVIYVIPFTSIIEQNAGIFKEILGNKNVLEHHSNFDWEKLKQATEHDNETNQLFEKLRLASENWDIPIVVTTNVQFFESLYANKKSKARKIHNIAKSVIIFDEAQQLPREYMRPCMLAVQELVKNYGSSAVFCTATQPNLQPFLPGVELAELAPNPKNLFEFYRRVSIQTIGALPDRNLVKALNDHRQALCIVNTRRHAKGLFDMLVPEGRFHLSTLMCAAHRKLTLHTIRESLNQGSVCRVISTQVMEAGVDLDFPVGYRALAGLDSIVQAAGRVNREQKQQIGKVFVFEPETEFIKRTPSFILQTSRAAESVLRDHSDDPTSIQAVDHYFTLLDTLQDVQRSTDVKNILALLNKPHFEFAKAADKFRVIENTTVPIIIQFNEEAQKLLRELRFHPYPASLSRQLQLYIVNLYENEFEALQAKGAIETYQEKYNVLTNLEFYNSETGVILPTDNSGEAIFFS